MNFVLPWYSGDPIHTLHTAGYIHADVDAVKSGYGDDYDHIVTMNDIIALNFICQYG